MKSKLLVILSTLVMALALNGAERDSNHAATRGRPGQSLRLLQP